MAAYEIKQRLINVEHAPGHMKSISRSAHEILAQRVGGLGFIPFLARKLVNAQLVLSNLRLNHQVDENLVDRFSWMVPSDEDDLSSFLENEKIFFAERYGGLGLGVHGGGARCGTDGDFSIKGIGCNPLIGDGAPLDYAHGGTSLSEAIQEALWGEIFHIALPFGAARIMCVLSTGTSCWWVIRRWGKDLLRDRYGEDVYLPRGIAIREVTVRPAQFERSLFHRPQPAISYPATDDVLRVRAAVSVIESCLPSSRPNLYLDDMEAQTVSAGIGGGITEVVRRFAAQAAAAKSKCLLHGNIVSSNVCIDGRWIDYGSATAIPTWGEVGGYGPFWDDASVYAPIVEGLIAGVDKYAGSKGAGFTAKELLDLYKSTYARHFTIRCLSMTGVPFALLHQRFATPQAVRLYRAMLRVVKVGHRLPFEGHPDNDAQFGTYRLNDCLFDLALGNKRAQESLRRHLDDPSLRQELTNAHADFVAIAIADAEALGVQAENFRRLMALNSCKSAMRWTFLYRPHMVMHVERLIAEHRGAFELRQQIETLLDEVVNYCAMRYEDAAGFATLLWLSREEEYRYDAMTDEIARGVSGSVPSRCARTESQTLPICDQTLPHWGLNLWKCLYEM